MNVNSVAPRHQQLVLKNCNQRILKERFSYRALGSANFPTISKIDPRRLVVTQALVLNQCQDSFPAVHSPSFRWIIPKAEIFGNPINAHISPIMRSRPQRIRGT